MKDRPRLTKDGELRTPTETRKAAKQVTDGVLNGTHYIEIDGVKKHIKFDMTRNRTFDTQAGHAVLMDHHANGSQRRIRVLLQKDSQRNLSMDTSSKY